VLNVALHVLRFMKIYVTVLPLSTALRCWDCVFGYGPSDGPCVLVAIGLAILSQHRRDLLRETRAEDFMSTLKRKCANTVDADALLKRALDKRGLTKIKEQRQITLKTTFQRVHEQAAFKRPKAKQRSETVAVETARPAATTPSGVASTRRARSVSVAAIPKLDLAPGTPPRAHAEPMTAPARLAHMQSFIQGAQIGTIAAPVAVFRSAEVRHGRSMFHHWFAKFATHFIIVKVSAVRTFGKTDGCIWKLVSQSARNRVRAKISCPFQAQRASSIRN
jgi:hypothetical protein